MILLLSRQKAHGVEGHFKLRADADKKGTGKLFYATPIELKREKVIVAAGVGIAIALGLEVPTIVQSSFLLLQVEVDPIVETRHLSIASLANKYMLPCRYIYVFWWISPRCKIIEGREKRACAHVSCKQKARKGRYSDLQPELSIRPPRCRW
jgi:hypothetical protein